MSLPLNLDPKCIMKQGYLIKSPPMRDATVIRKRWHMRWFVLYDTQGMADNDSAVEREVDLLYYKNDTKVTQKAPKGKISLIGAEVYKHRGKLNGYTYIINVQTDDRLYHLCSTQVFVHNEWLEKIRDHHIPYTEVPRDSFPRCPSTVSFTKYDHETRRSSIPPDDRTTPSERTYSAISYSSVISNSSVTSNSSFSSNSSLTSNSSATSSDGYDLTSKKTHVYAEIKPRSRSCIPTRNFYPTTCLSTSAPTYEKPIPLPPGKEHVNTTYVGMKSYKILESEDEGIGRTDSESSSTSSHTSTSVATTLLANDTWKLPKRDSLLGDFVGPRLTTSKCKPLNRANSMVDYSPYFGVATTPEAQF